MLEIVGLVAVFVVMFYVTMTFLLIAFNTLGTYNIGGVPNKLLVKILVLVLGALVSYGWYLFLNMFSLTIQIIKV